MRKLDVSICRLLYICLKFGWYKLDLLKRNIFCVVELILKSTKHLSLLNLFYLLTVPVMMDECMEYLEKRAKTDSSFTYEVIIVDDGSKDKTSQVGLGYGKKYGTDKVRVLTLAKNRGKGGAVRMVRYSFLHSMSYQDGIIIECIVNLLRKKKKKKKILACLIIIQ